MLILRSGDVTVRTVDAGRVWLDGGAMFGVVPKPLWERRTACDERNRIPLAMRCLLVESAGTRILVDTGAGDKEGAKFREIYGLDNAGRPTRLHDSLRREGVEPEAIDVVVSTHLHFDHAGGNTTRDADGTLRPTFPRARYVIRRSEWEFGRRDNERIRASYLPDNFLPLEGTDRLELVEGDVRVAPGVRLLHAPGHTPHHQCVLVEAGEETILYLADLVPTRAHLPLPWIMGYDLEPLVTLETKREVLGRAAEGAWTLVFEHDPVTAAGRARPRRDGRDGCELVEPREDEDVPEEVRRRLRPVEG